MAPNRSGEHKLCVTSLQQTGELLLRGISAPCVAHSQEKTIAHHGVPLMTLVQPNAAAIGASAMSWRRPAERGPTLLSSAVVCVSQHCMGPVLHWPGGGAGAPHRATGVTDAVTLLAAAKTTTKEARELWNSIVGTR